MSLFLIGWSSWLADRLGKARNLVRARPFKDSLQFDLETAQAGHVAIWVSWCQQPQEFADSFYLTESSCCCGKCGCRIVLPSAVCRLFCLTQWRWDIIIPWALRIQPKLNHSSKANSCMIISLPWTPRTSLVWLCQPCAGNLPGDLFKAQLPTSRSGVSNKVSGNAHVYNGGSVTLVGMMSCLMVTADVSLNFHSAYWELIGLLLFSPTNISK